MNEMKMQGWVARDEDGVLWLYIDEKPEKTPAHVTQRWNPNYKGCWASDGVETKVLDSALFPSVTWEDAEPTEVEITIKIKEA